MPMKLGQRCICPITGVRGTVVGFRAGMPIGRSKDGKIFNAAKSAVGRPKMRYLVRVLDEGEILTPWMKAERDETTKRFRILGDDPVFFGALVDADTLEVREDDGT